VGGAFQKSSKFLVSLHPRGKMELRLRLTRSFFKQKSAEMPKNEAACGLWGSLRSHIYAVCGDCAKMVLEAFANFI
jgi:hypothetical protein